MSPQAFENLSKKDHTIIHSADYAQMVADLEDPTVQEALQIDPNSERIWQNSQAQDIDFDLCENSTSRQYDDDPTFANWFQLPKRERMRRLAQSVSHMA